mmetsp:Transcript_40824/g.131312  ORF Transcript_40824/g.131312 Transcript_40824/m.131312 type:complete len:453 (-) Transcript_40824:22-1380(-)
MSMLPLPAPPRQGHWRAPQLRPRMAAQRPTLKATTAAQRRAGRAGTRGWEVLDRQLLRAPIPVLALAQVPSLVPTTLQRAGAADASLWASFLPWAHQAAVPRKCCRPSRRQAELRSAALPPPGAAVSSRMSRSARAVSASRGTPWRSSARTSTAGTSSTDSWPPRRRAGRAPAAWAPGPSPLPLWVTTRCPVPMPMSPQSPRPRPPWPQRILQVHLSAPGAPCRAPSVAHRGQIGPGSSEPWLWPHALHRVLWPHARPRAHARHHRVPSRLRPHFRMLPPLGLPVCAQHRRSTWKRVTQFIQPRAALPEVAARANTSMTRISSSTSPSPAPPTAPWTSLVPGVAAAASAAAVVAASYGHWPRRAELRPASHPPLQSSPGVRARLRAGPRGGCRTRMTSRTTQWKRTSNTLARVRLRATRATTTATMISEAREVHIVRGDATAHSPIPVCTCP